VAGVQDKIHSDGGRVSRLITSGRKNAEIVDELFLATLTRRPSPEEERELVARLDRVAYEPRQSVETSCGP